MKGRPIDQLVYEYMFPRPKQTDPVNFHAFLQRHLIPEVRGEVHAFYGHLETQEAKYPGLDYTNHIHRIRLSRWPWHRRLFRSFDGLRLTHSEIMGLTKWEGTKWAKEKYEKEQGVVIRDTTADDLPDWIEPTEDVRRINAVRRAALAVSRNDDQDDSMEDEDSEEELESVGVELNERLRAQAARREAGDTSAILDDEWEQWLKNAIETGELAAVTEELTDHLFQHASSSGRFPEDLVPNGMINAARAGQWSEIPESLHSMLQRLIDSNRPDDEDDGEEDVARTRTPTASSSASRRQALGTITSLTRPVH